MEGAGNRFYVALIKNNSRKCKNFKTKQAREDLCWVHYAMKLANDKAIEAKSYDSNTLNIYSNNMDRWSNTSKEGEEEKGDRGRMREIPEGEAGTGQPALDPSTQQVGTTQNRELAATPASPGTQGNEQSEVKQEEDLSQSIAALDEGLGISTKGKTDRAT